MDSKVLLVAAKRHLFDELRTEAGFQRFAVLTLGGPASAAVAYK